MASLKQRERKRLLAQAHSVSQWRKKQAAIEASRSAKTGKPTKNGMEQHGYVSNGRGGWRPINKVKDTDKITKKT